MESKYESLGLSLEEPELSNQISIRILFGQEAIKDQNSIRLITELYAQVFAGPPWNEFSRCPRCGKFYGQDNPIGSFSSCCKQQLVEAYPLEETINYIEAELGKLNAVLAYLSRPNGKIIGFAWGYQTTSQEFANEKYQTGEMRETIINLLSSARLPEKSLVYYFSECGVAEEHRGRRYANELTQAMVDAAQSLGLPLLMRTNSQSPMVAVAQKFRMTQCFGQEVIYQDGQIITTGNTVNGLDKENSNRVLFLKI